MLSWATTMESCDVPPRSAVAGELARALHGPSSRCAALIEPWLLPSAATVYRQHGTVCGNYTAITGPSTPSAAGQNGYRNTVLRLLEHWMRPQGPDRDLVASTIQMSAIQPPAIGSLHEADVWWDYG